jgi:hypothetical protein
MVPIKEYTFAVARPVSGAMQKERAPSSQDAMILIADKVTSVRRNLHYNRCIVLLYYIVKEVTKFAAKKAFLDHPLKRIDRIQRSFRNEWYA